LPSTRARRILLRCGVDGTDKEINAGEYGAAPDGFDFLTIGHENFGRVEAVGPNVADLKPGDYVGVTAVRGADGAPVAREVHTIARTVPEGHGPWDLEPGSTMTNATIDAPVAASGNRELTLKYKGGSQTIRIPDGIPIVTQVPADRSYLKPGEYVFVSARKEPDGSLTALRVQVSKDGVKPPQ
jgi:NADPH:quinone reductase-like Zn-dependent oxidoreductase